LPWQRGVPSARYIVTFGVLVLGTVLVIGALYFLPALSLGPVAEFLQP
jgi:K+-transporting ATPase A subunit